MRCKIGNAREQYIKILHIFRCYQTSTFFTKYRQILKIYSNMIEEMEIKIEYIYPNEVDPLKEDVFQAFQNKVESDKSQEQQTIQKSINEDNTTKKSNLNNHHLSKSDSRIIHWYDSIDSNGRLLCKFCELRYSTTQTLRHHVQTKHQNEAMDLRNKIIKNKRNSKHLCHVCKKRLKSVIDLKEHLNNNHSMEALSLSCLFCEATFINSEELTNHMHIIHKKVCNVFICLICGYRTIKKSHFNKHTNTHVLEKSILCKYCDYKTNNNANLKVHEYIHTNKRPYVCQYKGCDYSSAAKSGLRSHQLKHFPERNMLICDKCSYSTVYKQSLKKHINSHKRISMKNIL